MILLSIETSCDETGAAVVEGEKNRVRIITNNVGSQIKTHKPYGGVVPELAARKHAEDIIPVVDHALRTAFLHGDWRTRIDALAVTSRPGLMVSLLVGLEAAKQLAWSLNKPLISVNHLEGHVYSVLGGECSGAGKNFKKNLEVDFFDSPTLALVVSGGHTELVHILNIGEYELLGKTRDDAAGEAFDKVAKMLGMPYPGGPEVSKAASVGNRSAYDFPRPMAGSDNLDFSFSGIKTHVLYLIKELQKRHKKLTQKHVSDISASFEEAIADTLIFKTITAAKEKNVENIIVTGGVSANARLRQKLSDIAAAEGLSAFFPPLSLTGDNAAMIGIAGYLTLQKYGYCNPFRLIPQPKAQW